jgi:hypothetical protein
VDRDGAHFGHFLEYLYMRDGVISGSSSSVSLLRALKRELGFYCIEPPIVLDRPSDVAFVMGGNGRDRNGRDSGVLSTVARYDASSGGRVHGVQWQR